MKLQILSTTKENSQKRREFAQLTYIFKEFLKIDLEINFIYDKNLLKKVTVANGSIVQSSLLDDVVGNPDWLHCYLTDSNWRKLKLKSTLYGEHQKVGGLPITFGRWHQRSRYRRAKKFYHEVDGIYEHVLGMLHEFIHSREGSLAVAHSYMYGYNMLYLRSVEKVIKPKRYVKEVSLLKALEHILNYNPFQKIVKVIEAKVNTPTKKYKYFTESEVEGLDTDLVVLLDKARETAGIPFVINSGFRTVAHNKKVGGVANSSHLTGKAVDLRARDGAESYAIIKSAIEVGIKRIGINRKKKFIHLDIDYTKSSPTIYEY